jgi:hypothetical protein
VNLIPTAAPTMTAVYGGINEQSATRKVVEVIT